MQHPGARYLIRLDDISPASNWPRLLAIEEFLNSMAIQPIVAVVPDNRDRELMKHPPDPAFWSHIRRWQDRGWSIGVHGLHHTLSVPDGGLLQLNRRSEFAGVPEEIQYGKIRRAAAIFSRNGVSPDLWIAPAHSFDKATLKALRRNNITTISDGFYLFPGKDPEENLWIPQQLWRFRKRFMGVWTVCYHPMTWTPRDHSRFTADVLRWRGSITCLANVQDLYRNRRLGACDEVFSAAYRLRVTLPLAARNLLSKSLS